MAHQAVLLPGFWELWSLFLSGHQHLHVLKGGVVPRLGLEGHLVFWHCLPFKKTKQRKVSQSRDIYMLTLSRITEKYSYEMWHIHNPLT